MTAPEMADTLWSWFTSASHSKIFGGERPVFLNYFWREDWISHPYSIESGLMGNTELLKQVTVKSSSTPSTIASCDHVLKLCFAFLLHSSWKEYPCEITPCLGIGGWWTWFHAPLTCLSGLSWVPATQWDTSSEDDRVGFSSSFTFSGLVEQSSCIDLLKPTGG